MKSFTDYLEIIQEMKESKEKKTEAVDYILHKISPGDKFINFLKKNKNNIFSLDETIEYKKLNSNTTNWTFIFKTETNNFAFLNPDNSQSSSKDGNLDEQSLSLAVYVLLKK